MLTLRNLLVSLAVFLLVGAVLSIPDFGWEGDETGWLIALAVGILAFVANVGDRVNFGDRRA